MTVAKIVYDGCELSRNKCSGLLNFFSVYSALGNTGGLLN